MHRRERVRASGWWIAGGALVASVCTVAVDANAQHAPSVSPTASPALRAALPPLVAPSAALDAAEADIRTRWIQDRLDAETPAAQRWYWIFLTLSVGATAGQFALGATDNFLNPGFTSQIGWYVGGVNAAIGTLPMIIFPFRPAFAAGELRHDPAGTEQQRIARMHHAEALLRECAEGEDFGAGWAMHALGVVLGVGSSIVLLGLLDMREVGSWVTVASNLVVTIGFNEFQVLTQPTHLIQDWSTYQRDRWRTMATRTRRNDGVRITPVPFFGGGGVVVQF